MADQPPLLTSVVNSTLAQLTFPDIHRMAENDGLSALSREKNDPNRTKMYRHVTKSLASTAESNLFSSVPSCYAEFV